MKHAFITALLFVAMVAVLDDAQSQPWNVANTGTSHTIIIPAAVGPAVEGKPLTSGDYIGIFYDSGGSPVCAGLGAWTGSNISVSAFGNDPLTPGKDGFANGEEFHWRIWRHEDQKTFEAMAEYQPVGGVITNTNTYAPNGISSLSSLSAPIPVQLVNFAATIVVNRAVRLEWATISEVNTYGFEVQKSAGAPDYYRTISNSFVPGHGTTVLPHSYGFTDSLAISGTWFYRLKQIDFDSSVLFLGGIRVDVLTAVHVTTLPAGFTLDQNYPNPFNPSTTIRFGAPVASHVSLKVYNTAGQEVAVLVDEVKTAGLYDVSFNASNLASGTYFYRLQAREFGATKKLSLVR